MKGSYRVIVQNKRIRYDFEIRRNITIVRGDSATGKTALIDMVREYFENGAGSAVNLFCEKNCAVVEGRTWTGQLSEIKDSIVFIDEGNEFVMSDEFSNVIQKTDNYYVIVSREGIPSLPYSVDEIYGIRNSGKYGTLQRTYNEFYHIYSDND
ncbi:MAG: Fis family transcriptional regulator [Clostridiales bacterium]|nr:Fis family transcriptional regulator [Clostridiales bacterium]